MKKKILISTGGTGGGGPGAKSTEVSYSQTAMNSLISKLKIQPLHY